MKIVHEIDRQKWSEFVFQHPHGNIFQTPEMYEVYSKTKNYEPFIMGVMSDAGGVLAVLLAVIQREYDNFMGDLTARAIIWGGPLVEDDDAGILKLILQEYENLVGNSVIYTQFRNLWDTREFSQIFGNYGYGFEDHLNIVIDLHKPLEILWKEMHPTRRKQVNRARKRGTEVRESSDPEQTHIIYGILKEVYHEANLPIADNSLFASAFEILAPSNMIHCFLATNNNEIIGVRCFLAYRGVLYDWYAGSLHKHLDKYPNDLLPWEVFKWGSQNGYQIFDFGGAGKPDKDYGVRDYKKKFGGEFVNLGRFQKVHKPIKYLIAKVGYGAWRFFKGKTPVGAKRL